MIATLDAPAEASVSTGLTLEEFYPWSEREDARYELVEGQLVIKPVSFRTSLVAANLNVAFVLWAERTGAGMWFPESPFRSLPSSRRTVRKPDGAFLSNERLIGSDWEDAYINVAPDLTVEVISPNDKFYDVDRKLAEYFEAGVRRAWIINPDVPSVRVHRSFEDVTILRPGDELMDEEVLPGFRCPVAALFVRPGQPSVV